MKRIYMTLGERVRNEGDNPEDKGSLVILDWEKKQVLKTISVTGRQSVDKGRSRGTSGLDFFEGFLYVATRTDLVAFNPDALKEDHRISIPIDELHQIKTNNNVLWLTTMRRNMKVAIQNKKIIDIVPTIYSGVGDNQFPPGCFNALAWSPNGDEYHMYTGPEQIYNFTKGEVVIQGNLHGGPHDLCFLNEKELLFTRSIHKELIWVDLQTKEVKKYF